MVELAVSFELNTYLMGLRLIQNGHTFQRGDPFLASKVDPRADRVNYDSIIF